MKNGLVLLLSGIFLFGAGTLRAEDATPKEPVCKQGRVIFGKLTCAGSENSETLLDAYFYGATSFEEIRSRFSDRFQRIQLKCEQKFKSRGLASVVKPKSRELLGFRVDSVDACLGKRGYQQPCVTNSDCLENYCHPERGTCSTVFTVPVSAAQ